MKLIKHNPELAVFDNLFDSFFRDEPLHWMQKNNAHRGSVKVNIHENDEAYHLEVLAPGFSKEDLHIELEKGLLSLKAERKEESENNDKIYTRREFSLRQFERRFRLPENQVDEEKIHASFKDGILYLSIPKLQKVENENKKLIDID